MRQSRFGRDVYFDSPTPALAVDSQDSLWVAWRGADDKLYLRQRTLGGLVWSGEGWVEGDPEWGPAQAVYDNPSCGLDMVVDNNDTPQWISGQLLDGSCVQLQTPGGPVVDENLGLTTVSNPTLAVGPGGRLAAVWQARPPGQSETRLYQATYGHITKHYYANGRRIATRVDGEVYYTLPDPTGASLTLVDETGNDAGHDAGHILYDAFGGVLTNTLTAEVAAALGSVPEADTGLIHLGGGRYYSPALGRPLQPNPIGGPPAVPQALNRYAATSLGQPGVAEAAQQSVLYELGITALQSTIGSGIGKGLGIGFKQVGQALDVGYLRVNPWRLYQLKDAGYRHLFTYQRRGWYISEAVQPVLGNDVLRVADSSELIMLSKLRSIRGPKMAT